jgi:hypothetical protein
VAFRVTGTALQCQLRCDQQGAVVR